ncbi:MAG: TIGR00282 family metallophosphoesterase [Candidatus Omnitrophica bacterium CG11_big_fil_rev_8_21_14_0_20_42_13]|uniref:TIGR00282 family metallophosphoesterase n=1 Tax=Candidatus Ghiorseimicrobium undicola TaxID=1974746 RepID=A0A2H0LX51_9BACT|nr:MAG: TIGR00282 family metallophosphoesterase [Candidatus Omnitrophica bacterium CG11_big_fil_rev_8_21_14_0_20_42_13]
MNILFIGDIVGKPGRQAIKQLLPKIVEREGIGLVIANAENAAGGSSLNPNSVNELFQSGIDVLTSGDHIFRRPEALKVIDHPFILRPENLPPAALGKGHCLIEKNGISIAVLNLQGRVFMSAIECPFRAAQSAIEKIKNDAKIIIVDIHAEATSEKIALSFFLEGEVSAVLGTHTHVQTADEKILPAGTAYISDAGMTGPCDSVIGRRKEKVIEKFVTGMPTSLEVASEDIQLQGVVVDIDEQTGRARAIKRIKEKL